MKSGNAEWKLFMGENPKPLFEYTSVDVLLVYNLVVSSISETQQPLQSEESGKFAKKTDMKTSFVGRPNQLPPAPASLPQPPQAKFTPVPPRQQPQADPITENQEEEIEIDQEQTILPGDITPPPEENALYDETRQLPRSGDISSIAMPALLQKISQARGTGRLDVRTQNESTATVFIQDGFPVDATAGDVVGDEAMIELLTWQEGSFSFEPRVLRNNHTVYESIESLVAQSKQLAEHSRYLKEAGMTPTSTFFPINTALTQGEFSDKVTLDCPCDMETIARVYCSLNGKQTFEEMVRALFISRIQLTHIVHHLIVQDVIKIVENLTPQSSLTLAPRAIDNAAIQSIMMSLRRAETGLFIFPAFLYFLEQEYFRSYRSRTSFSVVVFELRQKKIVDGETVLRVLPDKMIMDAVLRISNLKRHVDLIAHYDAYDYALLLPSTRAQGAEVFVNRIIKCLTDSPLAGEPQANQLAMAFGSSSVPEDFKELGALLGAADLAMQQARAAKRPLVMYRDIKNQVAPLA